MAIATDRGRVANYIPELAGVNSALFGIAVALPTGETLAAGELVYPVLHPEHLKGIHPGDGAGPAW